jgi:hypothetical protein
MLTRLQWVDRIVNEVVRLFPALGRRRALAAAGLAYTSDANPPEVAAMIYAVEVNERILGPRPKLSGWGTSRRCTRLRRVRRR